MEGSKKVGLKEIPAVILEADDLKATELAMVENSKRGSNPVEEAEVIAPLKPTYGLTQRRLLKEWKVALLSQTQ